SRNPTGGISMKIVPINGHVLVEPLESADQTAGGIHLPNTAKEQRREGKVVKIAEDAIEEVALGDRVIYKEFGGTGVNVDGEDYVLLTTDDLLVKYVATDEIPE
ncbi:MAG: co-chaperone GroES, partial [Planctomycetota bacterium]